MSYIMPEPRPNTPEHTRPEHTETTPVMVSEVFNSPPQPSFSSPALLPLAPFALLASVTQMITGEDVPVSQLDKTSYEPCMDYICEIIDDGSISSVIPNFPPERCDGLRRTAMLNLKAIRRRIHGNNAPAPAAPAPLPPDRVGRNPLDKRWTFNGTTCAQIAAVRVSPQLWLETILAELKGAGVLDGILQGQYMRQLLDSPLRDQLVRKIEELPDVKAAVEAGTATLESHYAAALIACADPGDALACHYEACRPRRRAGEKLSDAVARVEMAFRAAAAHGCSPTAAGRFWAIFGLLTPAEQSAYTGRPGVLGQLRRPLHESDESAAARYRALLTDLTTWSKAQSTTAAAVPRPPSQAPASPPATPGTGSAGRSASPRRHRRRSSATAAAAAPPTVSVNPAESQLAGSGSEEEEEDISAPPPAHAAAAAAPANPHTPLVYYYTGDRANDAAKTARRRARGECLKCIPGGRIHTCPCPLHPSGQMSAAPRCFPYRS